MSTHDQPRDCPDWFCVPARCRCGADDWKPECDHYETPATIVRGEN